MICPKCSGANPDDSRKCAFCGEDLKLGETGEENLNDDKKPEVELTEEGDLLENVEGDKDGYSISLDKADDIEKMGEDEVSYLPVEAGGELVLDEPPKKKNKIAMALIPIGIIAVLVAAFFGLQYFGLFKNTGDEIQAQTLPTVYLKGSTLFMKYPEDKASSTISENFVVDPQTSQLNTMIVVSSDGNYMYYLDAFNKDVNKGNLMVKQKGKDPVNLATDVQMVVGTSKYGDTVVYLKEFNQETGVGSLFANYKGKEIPIADNAIASYTVLSGDGSVMAFGDNMNTTEYSYDLKIMDLKTSQSKPVEEKVYGALMFTEDNKNLLYIKDLDTQTVKAGLYLFKDLTESVKVVDAFDLNTFSANKANDFLVGEKSADSTSRLVIKKSQDYTAAQTEENASNGFVVDEKANGVILDNYSKGNFAYVKDFVAETYVGTVNVCTNGKSEPVEVTTEAYIDSPNRQCSTFKTTGDFNYYAYVSNFTQDGKGTLNIKPLSGDKVQISEGVTTFWLPKNSNKVFYVKELTDQGFGNLYSNSFAGDKEEKISDDVVPQMIFISDDGNELIYVSEYDMTNGMGNMKSYKNGQSTTIYEGLGQIACKDYRKIIIGMNFNQELGTFDLVERVGDGQAVAIEQGVERLLSY